jgi:hypothetical protein
MHLPGTMRTTERSVPLTMLSSRSLLLIVDSCAAYAVAAGSHRIAQSQDTPIKPLLNDFTTPFRSTSDYSVSLSNISSWQVNDVLAVASPSSLLLNLSSPLSVG